MLTHSKSTMHDLPRSANANAFEFGPRDFATGDFQPSKFSH